MIWQHSVHLLREVTLHYDKKKKKIKNIAKNLCKKNSFEIGSEKKKNRTDSFRIKKISV